MAESSTLFQGINFWLARKIPSRRVFVEDIQKHGGTVVPVERMADMLIVDHLLKDNDLPKNSALYSYRFIERSIKNGVLEDKEKHNVETRPTPFRPVGDQTQTAKTMRVPFTKEDDEFLIDWISRSQRALQGDVAFQELEAVNGRHPWQSWRSRWVKRLRHLVTIKKVDAATAPATAPAAIDTTSTAPSAVPAHKEPNDKRPKFPSTQQEKIMLINTIPPPHRFIVYNHANSGRGKQPRSDSNHDGQRNFRNIAPKPDQGERHSVSSQNQHSVDSNAIHARLANDPEQNINYTSASISHPPNGSHIYTPAMADSRALQNGELTARYEKAINEHRQLPRLNQIVSPTASKQTERVPDPQSMAEYQTLEESSYALHDTPSLLDSGQRADIEQAHSAKMSLKKQSHRTVEDGDVSDIPADPFTIASQNSSKNCSVEELLWHEEVAVQIWTDILNRTGTAGTHRSEGTAFLIANAKIIRDLDEEAFQAVWDIWWQSRPERTEEEWAEHFNQFCIPFYAAHVEAFRKLYEQRLKSNTDGAGGDGAARIYGSTDHATHMLKSPELGRHDTLQSTDIKDEQAFTAVRASRPEASPELGSKVQNTQRSPESMKRQQHVIKISTEAASPLKRARSPSEVPESPESPHDTNVLVSKRYRPETDRQVSARSNLGDVGVQANIDRQLWLEEEAEGVFVDEQKISANHSQSGDTTTSMLQDEDRILRAGQLANDKAKKEGSLQRLAIPKPPSVSELSETSNIPHNPGPFYEASELAVQGNFEDLMSQNTEHRAASFVSQSNIVPLIEEKYSGTPKSSEHTYNDDSESQLEDKHIGIHEWIQRKLERGYSKDVLELVLDATMMDLKLVPKTLRYYQKYDRIPNKRPGIWTQEDDNVLLKRGRKGRRALVAKHGTEALEQRRDYLEKKRLSI